MVSLSFNRILLEDCGRSVTRTDEQFSDLLGTCSKGSSLSDSIVFCCESASSAFISLKYWSQLVSSSTGANFGRFTGFTYSSSPVSLVSTS